MLTTFLIIIILILSYFLFVSRQVYQNLQEVCKELMSRLETQEMKKNVKITCKSCKETHTADQTIGEFCDDCFNFFDKGAFTVSSNHNLDEMKKFIESHQIED